MEVELYYFNYKTYSYESFNFSDLPEMDTNNIKSIRIKIHTNSLTKNLNFEEIIIEFNLHIGLEFNVDIEKERVFNELINSNDNSDINITNNLKYYYSLLCKLDKEKTKRAILVDLSNIEGYMLPLAIYPVDSKTICFNSINDVITYLIKLEEIIDFNNNKGIRKIYK